MLKSIVPLTAVLLACHAPLRAEAGASSISGTATYRERMALPPDAVFEATLEDVSRADAPAEVLGRVEFKSPLPPIRFTISFDPARIDATRRYAVRARIRLADELMFTTDTHYPVLGAGQTGDVDILLRRAGSGAAAAAAVPAGETMSTATLVNTYWKLIRLGEVPVTVGESQREPYFVLQTEQNRVAGYGGCNRMMGSYELEGEQLRFGQMAGTMMACAEGMEQESAFHKALGEVARWRVVGETLELFDAAGNPVAFFQSRYMK